MVPDSAMIGIKQGAAGRGIAGIEWLRRERESIDHPWGKLLWVSRLTATFKEKIKLIPGQIRGNLDAEAAR
jgi:hypothetical protein